MRRCISITVCPSVGPLPLAATSCLGIFLDADTHLFKWVWSSVRLSFRPSVNNAFVKVWYWRIVGMFKLAEPSNIAIKGKRPSCRASGLVSSVHILFFSFFFFWFLFSSSYLANWPFYSEFLLLIFFLYIYWFMTHFLFIHSSNAIIFRFKESQYFWWNGKYLMSFNSR